MEWSFASIPPVQFSWTAHTEPVALKLVIGKLWMQYLELEALPAEAWSLSRVLALGQGGLETITSLG